MVFSTAMAAIKRYWSIGVGLLVAGLWAAVKILGAKNKNLKNKNESLEAQNKHARSVAEGDVVIDIKSRSRRADALKEINEKGSSDLLSDPNNPKHWMHDDEDRTD